MHEPATASTPLPQRPGLNPAVPIIELPGGGLQLGWSRRNRVSGMAAEAVRECLARLRAQDPLSGYPLQHRAALQLLAAAGALLSAQAPSAWSRRSAEERDRLRALAQTVQRCDAHDVVEARRSARVAVVAPPGWQDLPRALADLAVGSAASPENASAVVLVGRAPFNQVSALMRRGTPHLAVVERTSSIRIGPLVVPSVTACLQCLHLARRDRDREHPRVALALEHWHAPPRDPVLVRQAALLAARVLVGYLDGTAGAGGGPGGDGDRDGGGGRDGVGGRYWTVAADLPEVAATPVARHPLCDCWWEPLAASG